jgi:hypothetical protein
VIKTEPPGRISGPFLEKLFQNFSGRSIPAVFVVVDEPVCVEFVGGSTVEVNAGFPGEAEGSPHGPIGHNYIGCDVPDAVQVEMEVGEK